MIVIINLGVEMRVSKKQKEKIRTDMLDAAGQGFREMGYEGLGIDGLVKRIGMTSGVFYSHFSSKQEAFKAVLNEGLLDYADNVEKLKEAHDDHWPQAFLEYYLGNEHVENIACSCAVPGLSADVVRSDTETKKMYEKQVSDIAEKIAEGLKQDELENTWALMGLLTGAVILARSVSNPKKSQQILESAKNWAEKMVTNQ